MESSYRIVQLLRGEYLGERVSINGWVGTRRESKGGFSFIEVNDGSALKPIQVIADNTLDNYVSEISKLTTGCSVRVEGELVESQGKGQLVEIKAHSIKVHGWAEGTEYPLQKKRHSFEFLRQIAHLRPRTNTFGAIARLRNAVSAGIHGYFQNRGFIYLHTPIITGSDCEGAGEAFQITTLNMNALQSGPEYKDDFFGKKAFLTVSGQLEAEIYAMALGNVYTFGPTFRAENSNTPRHLAEFWMVEPEMAFCELDGNMDIGEALLKSVISFVVENCAEDLELFKRFINPKVMEILHAIIDLKFERITYTEAVAILEKSGRKFEFPVEWGSNLQAEHERFITEEVYKRPVIVIDYPRTIKPFYMRLNEDEKTVAAMDVLVPGIGEIIGGSQREERFDILMARIKEAGLNPEDYWWYLELRKYGTAPHSGFGLGFERLIQLITGMSNIRDVIPFPRTPGNLEF